MEHTGTREPAARLRLGFDIGSIAMKAVVMDRSGRVLERVYERTAGRPRETAVRVLARLLERWQAAAWDLLAATGSGARTLAPLVNAAFFNEVICQAAAVRHLCPGARTLLEIGGQESKLISLADGTDQGRLFSDFSITGQCAAGTGSFLDQQAARLGIRIEGEFARLALAGQRPPAVAGRCSVFAKSDMVHLQQRATPLADILAGLCLGLARNLRSNLARGQQPARPMVLCGGVAANGAVVRALAEVFELASGELIVPELHAFTGAVGAVLLCAAGQAASGAQGTGPGGRPVDLSLLEQTARPRRVEGVALEPLCVRVRPESPPPTAAAGEQSPQAGLPPTEGVAAADPIDAYLGADVGSISTKIAVIDAQQRLLAKIYLMTAGQPLQAVRQALREIGRQVGDTVRIRGAGTTGSGRYLIGDFLGADLVVNEITAQATAATALDPLVDTIFEIGGQDSKYIRLLDEVVVDFEMNHACAAGTGSFLEEQAQRLGIDLTRDFARLALGSPRPAPLGDRCTVFIESDLVSLQHQGTARDDLVAGLCYAVVNNYLNRVVGRRRLGRRIFFQGGTAFNRAVVAAFEKVTGQQITVPPHHEVTGAIGAAILAQRHQARHGAPSSRFGGFGLAESPCDVGRFTCRHCDNGCEINRVRLPGRPPLHYGSRCDRWNVSGAQPQQTNLPDLFAERHELLLGHAGLAQPQVGSGPRVGIPMALANCELLPLWATLLSRLGFRVVLSAVTDGRTTRRGIEAVLANCCFPVKIAHGHAFQLADRQVDYLWAPGVASLGKAQGEPPENHLCPYVAGLPWLLQAALEQAGKTVRILGPLVRLHEGPQALVRSLEPLRRQFAFSRRRLRGAVVQAWDAQQSFAVACRRRGKDLLASLPAARSHVVLVGRPYSACDPGAYLDLAGKLRALGALPIPLDYLDLSAAESDGDSIARGMYWRTGQRSLRAADLIAADPRLSAVYLSNFSCGPDSFIIDYFRRRTGSKPVLVLETDEHTADAGLMTRLEAFLDSLDAAAWRRAPRREVAPRCQPGRNGHQPTIYVPWMGDQSYGMAAAFRAHGHDARVIPIADHQSTALGRRYLGGKQCLPCIITAGDMIRVTREPGFDPQRAAFLMPGGSGPCRFGQYSCRHQLLLEELELGSVPVLAPSQDKRLYQEWGAFRGQVVSLAWYGLVAFDILLKACLAVRPYEIEAGATDRVYRKWCRGMRRLIAMRPAERQLRDLLRRAADDFAAVAVDRSRCRPKIGVVGEVYVRLHDTANDGLLRHLESLGAQTRLASYLEWHYYTNWVRANDAWRRGQWREWLLNAQKTRVQRARHYRLAAAFARHFGDFTEPPTEKLLELASPYLHPELKGGDAVLAVGGAVEMLHGGCQGVVNAMPFSCMPSTLVDTVMKVLAQRFSPRPLVTISYDGHQDPALQTRLEALVYQAREALPR